MSNRGDTPAKPAWYWHLVGYAILALLASLLLNSLVAHPVGAAVTVPTKMNFQGRLTDASGAVVTDGLYNMQFRLYTISSGGSAVWTETRETTNRVQVTNGIFAVKLGDVTPLSASLFASGSLYFEVTLANPATATCSTSGCQTWESPMTARSLLSTSAYAYNAETLDGIDGASFAQLSTANTFTNTNLVSVANVAALQVTNGSTNMFKVDSSNSIITLGASDTTGAVLVLDVKTNSGDPTGSSAVVGAMYYNSNSGKFRCYQNTGWTDCITTVPTVNLQTAYTASTGGTTPEIKVDGTRGGVNIQDADTTIAGVLFSVNQSNASGQGTSLFSVSSTGAVSLGLAGQTTTLPGNISATGTFYNSVNSSTAFTIGRTGVDATRVFVADTTNSRVYIGNPTADATTVVFVLDNSTATEAASTNGAMYYNSTNNKFRCYQGGIWQDCVTRNRVTITSNVTNKNATANTMADVTGLSFAVTSGRRYAFECLIPYTSAAATTGSRWSINGPTTSALYYTSTYTLTATSATTNYASAYNTPTGSNASSLTTGNVAKISGYLVPSADGTVIVRFASEIANSAIIAQAGSSCEYWNP